MRWHLENFTSHVNSNWLKFSQMLHLWFYIFLMEESSGYGVIMFIDTISTITFQNLYLEEREHMQKYLTPPYYRFNAPWWLPWRFSLVCTSAEHITDFYLTKEKTAIYDMNKRFSITTTTSNHVVMLTEWHWSQYS